MNAQSWTHHREAGTPLAIRTIVLITQACGYYAGYALLYPTCLYFMLFRTHSVRASRHFLARVLGRPPAFREIFRHHLTFASCTLDRVRLARRPDDVTVRLHGREAIESSHGGGRGCLLFGAHLGSFEVLRALAPRYDLRVKALMYRGNAGTINGMTQRLDPGAEDMLIEIGRPDTLLRVKEALDAGETVGILADRVIDADKSIEVQFVGGPVRLPSGPFLLAMLLKAPIVLGFGICRAPSEYDVYFEVLADLPAVLDEADTQLKALAQRYADRVAHYAREMPYNWFNFYDYWHNAA
ncbi:MAG TPA: lipid A biosynthesis acyltransferase [Gammaproteobacteria bacterium]|nr:lipid A biosynthesis acyltransferase [Gammaproteobacteria bacterium]